MKAQWKIDFTTGYDISDNELYRIRELIADIIKPLADEYMANFAVTPSWHTPGPIRWEERYDIPATRATSVVNLPDYEGDHG